MKRSRLAERKLGKKVNHVKHKKPFPTKLLSGIILFFCFLIFAIYLILPRTWNGSSKISVAVQNQSGDIDVVILDPISSTITEMIAPGDTQIDAADNLGTWKLKSITKLGKDKKLGGDFMKNTVIKSFNFPIDNWADYNFLNLISGDLIKGINSLFATNSDLTFIDKVRILYFSLGVGNSDRSIINLEKTSFLNRSQLTDGSLGWKIGGNLPSNIISYFITTNSNMNVLINNASGGNAITDMYAKTLENLGINVASIRILDKSNSDCTITGLLEVTVKKLGKIFGCDTKITKPANNFDIQIDLGSVARSRF